MKISLPGVLERAAQRCKSADDWQTQNLAIGLCELLEHLRLVRGNPERIGEFFELWTDSEQGGSP